LRGVFRLDAQDMATKARQVLAVDKRSGTLGKIVAHHSGYYFFQPMHGGPEWQVEERWITFDLKAARDGR
jgi:hypothetical protein